ADLLASQVLHRIDRRVFACDDRHAAVARRTDDYHRLASSGAERGHRESVDSKIDRTSDDSVLAVGRALERHDLDLVTRGHELLIEVRRDPEDQLERTDLDDPVGGSGGYGTQRTDGTHGGKSQNSAACKLRHEPSPETVREAPRT